MTGGSIAGPVEDGVLRELEPGVMPRLCPLPRGGTLRLLEGGKGPTLVLLHGRGNAASTWFPLLPALARTHRVLALDLPGFGGSSPTPGSPRTAEEGLGFFAEPVETGLAALAPGPMTLVGHSLGGLVALELARRGRLSVERLVLIDSMGLGPEMARDARLYFRVGPERLARMLGPRLFGRIAPLPDTARNRRLMALDYELMAVTGGRPEATRAFNTLVPLTGDVFHLRERLGEVEQPTVHIWGAQDRVMPEAMAEAAARAQPSARLVSLETGHSPHLEQPEAVRALLAADNPT